MGGGYTWAGFSRTGGEMVGKDDNRKGSLASAFVFVLAGVVCSTVLVTLEASGQTYVDADITVDTNWTPSDAPYIVVGTVSVKSGVTLTIDAGVEVKFAQGAGLTVNGSLVAVGTNSSYVHFTSNKPEPHPGDWGTIKFVGESVSSMVLIRCVITFATDGVTLSSPQGGRAVVESSDISNNEASGIHVNQEDSSNLVIENNTLSNNGEHGIYAFSSYGIAINDNQVSGGTLTGIMVDYSAYSVTDTVVLRVHDVNLEGNRVSNAGQSGIEIRSTPVSGNPDFLAVCYLYNLTVRKNLVSAAGGTGIQIHCRPNAGRTTGSIVYNVEVQQNSVTSSIGNGIELSAPSGSTGPVTSALHDAIIAGNTVAGSGQNGMLVSALSVPYSETALYNVTITGNDVFDNAGTAISVSSYPTSSSSLATHVWITSNNVYSSQAGIVAEGLQANVTRNSIGYNIEGVEFKAIAAAHSIAHYNDVYRNENGINALGEATVDAENNYWGDSTGPYNPSINPNGQGNTAGGNGVNLDFVPWLTIPIGMIDQRPVARIAVDRNSAPVGDIVTFSANQSTDETRVFYFRIDFGDGSNSGWVDRPVFAHRYVKSGTFTALLVVKDNHGIPSNNTDEASVQVIVSAATQLPIPELPGWSYILILVALLMVVILIVVIKRARRPRPR